VGPIFSGLQVPGNINVFPSVDELSSWLDRQPIGQSLILLKGSRGIGLEGLKDRL
jgi:UDP-N-acetylmuramyl pentapeptide synthase